MEHKLSTSLYFYKLYNLNIKSHFYISELSHSQHTYLNNIDVTIVNGKCPKELSNPLISNAYYSINQTEALFCTEECGKFYITNGNTITIEPIAEPNYQHLKAYLLSRSFALLMFQRNTVAFHGSSMVFHDKVYTFCGNSGAGKSTLSAALTLKGYLLLSDDLSVVSFNNNTPEINSGFSHNKLCSDAIKHFNISTDKLTKVDFIADKYALPSSKVFVDTTFPLEILVELSTRTATGNDNTSVTIEEVFGQDKLQTVFRNIFRPQLLTDVGLNPIYLKHCLNISKNVRVFKMTRPKNIFTLEEQINLIEAIKKQGIVQ